MSRAMLGSLKSSRAWRAIVSLSLLLVPFGACTTYRGEPSRLFTIEQENAFASALSDPALYDEYAASVGPRRRELRDQIVLGRLYGIDVNYPEFEASLTQERQTVGFLATATNIALTTSAAVVAANEAKTLLAATAAGVTGAREGYDKDVLFDRSIALLQQQMRTQRALVRARIVGRLALDVTAYPLELALSDVETYYRAGTITGALIGASEDAGIRLNQAKALENEVVVTRFGPTRYGATILAYFRRGPTEREAVVGWLRDNGITVPVAIFANSPDYAAEQARAAARFGLTRDVAAPQLPPSVRPVRVATPVVQRAPGPFIPGPAVPVPPRPGPDTSQPTPLSSREITARLRSYYQSISGQDKVAFENRIRKVRPDLLVADFLWRPDYEADRIAILNELHLQ